MNQPYLNQEAIAQSVDVLKNLANPIRLSIAKLLLDYGELNVSAIQELLDLPQSSVSQHITRMRTASIVKDRRDGNRIFYSLPCSLTRDLVELLNYHIPT